MSMTTELELAQREKFEAWAEECCALPWGYLKERRTYSGHYSEHTYTSLWGAWKAACEGMVEALEARDKQIAELRVSNRILCSDAMAKQDRIAELEASHSKLRETLAGIHNTIRTDGSYTPLAAILNAVKRAHEESAAAAGVAVEGE